MRPTMPVRLWTIGYNVPIWNIRLAPSRVPSQLGNPLWYTNRNRSDPGHTRWTKGKGSWLFILQFGCRAIDCHVTVSGLFSAVPETISPLSPHSYTQSPLVRSTPGCSGRPPAAPNTIPDPIRYLPADLENTSRFSPRILSATFSCALARAVIGNQHPISLICNGLAMPPVYPPTSRFRQMNNK